MYIQQTGHVQVQRIPWTGDVLANIKSKVYCGLSHITIVHRYIINLNIIFYKLDMYQSTVYRGLAMYKNHITS